MLPCGVDTHRFRPIHRTEARARLGLDHDRPYLLFQADPSRPEKRYDLAEAAAGETPLLALKGVEPAEVPLWVNAANAVLVPSDREGFGLAVLEALACEVPVLATPVGIAPKVLQGIDGAYCGPFVAAEWRRALAPHLAAPDPRVQGRGRRGVLGGPDGRASAGRLAIAQLSSGQNSDSRLRAPAAGSAISTDSTDGAEMSASSVAPTDRASGRSA